MIFVVRTDDPTLLNVPQSADADARAADHRLDVELDQTFPASDPIPWIHDAPPRPLFLEDFTVGRRFFSAELLVEEEEIAAFASRFDPQPFHLDAQAARQSPFGGVAASGWHTAAMSMRLIVDGAMKISGGIVGLGGEIAWPRPTRPGDVLRVESEVVDVAASRSKPDRGLVTVRNTTLNQHGEPVQIATMKLLVPRKKSRPESSERDL
jgi:acyl dehydratase